MNTKIIKSCVRSIVYETIGSQCFFPTDVDFYHNGSDCAKCTRIRNLLQQVCSFPRLTAHIDSHILQNMANGDVQLPWNTAYDCGNIHKYVQKISSQVIHMTNQCWLSEYLIQAWHGLQTDEMDETREMLELVNQFSKSAISTNVSAYTSMKGSFRKRGFRIVVCLPIHSKFVLTCIAVHRCN
jgi:hypothetical protein